MTTAASESGFMGAPQKVTSVDDLTRPPEQRPRADYDWVYTLPASVFESASWRGCDADQHYAVKEPTLLQVQQIARNGDRLMTDVVPDFVRAIGARDENGRTILDAEGHPVLMAVGHVEAMQWMSRIGVKGAQLVAGEWALTWGASKEEGEALRGSRRRAP